MNALKDNPHGLHFSGHGVLNSVKEMGMQYVHLNKKENGNNCLVFETEEGAAHYVTEKQLKEEIKELSDKLDFVVVAACHSNFVG